MNTKGRFTEKNRIIASYMTEYSTLNFSMTPAWCLQA